VNVLAVTPPVVRG